MYKKMKRKSMSMLSCVLMFLVGVLTSDLVKPMIEKIPVIGDLFEKADDMVEGIAGKSADDDEEEV